GLEAPVLEREEAAGATEAGLHLVDAEERPVAAAQRLCAFEIALRRERAALPLDRLDDEDRDVLVPERLLERVEVAEGHAVEAGQKRTESVRERGVAVGRQRAERQPVEGARRRDHPRAPRRRAAELERGLDRLGAGAREEHALEARRRALEECLGKKAGERRDAELHRAWKLEVERLLQRAADGLVVPPDVVHAEAAEQVEVAVAVVVEEVRAVRARPRAVETDRLQHAHELRIDRARPARVLVAGLRQQRLEVERAHAPEVTRWLRGSRARDPRGGCRARRRSAG